MFLYLLRNDRRVDQEKIKEIFKEDREARKSQLKAEQLQKDQKFFSHLARVMKKKRSGVAKCEFICVIIKQEINLHAHA